MSDIFISHVEEDADVALTIALGLEEVGYSTWCYELDSIPGPSYLLQTGQAVANSKVVVVVISPHSVGSRQVTKEVVRAHETGKDFIPVRRDISHIEFQNRQPEWREAIGAAASIGIPEEAAPTILPRIIAGLTTLGIHPAKKPDSARIEQIRKALSELLVPTKRPELEHGSAEAVWEKVKPAVSAERPVQTAKPVTNLRQVLAGVLLGVGFIILIAGTAGYSALTDGPWYEFFVGLLILSLPFIVLGAYCLRRAMAQAHVPTFTRGKIPGWWWVLPVVLGFVGGMIAWIKQKDMDWRKATNLLTLGIVLSVFWVIPFLVLQTSAAPSISPVEPEPRPPMDEAKLIYEDDFSNPGSGWLRESKEECDSYYEDGEYHILVKRYDYATWVVNRNAGRFTNFILEIDARLVSGPNEAGYGVICRFQDHDSFYRFLVGDGCYLVGTRAGGVWTELQGKTQSASIKENHDRNHLKLVATGSKIQVYANGHHLATVTDDSFAEGYVGVIVDTPEADAHVAFDNIKVYSLD